MKKFENLNEKEKKIIANLIDEIMLKNNLTNIEDLAKSTNLSLEDTLKEILSEIKTLKATKKEEKNKICALGVCI